MNTLNCAWKCFNRELCCLENPSYHQCNDKTNRASVCFCSRYDVIGTIDAPWQSFLLFLICYYWILIWWLIDAANWQHTHNIAGCCYLQIIELIDYHCRANNTRMQNVPPMFNTSYLNKIRLKFLTRRKSFWQNFNTVTVEGWKELLVYLTFSWRSSEARMSGSLLHISLLPLPEQTESDWRVWGHRPATRIWLWLARWFKTDRWLFIMHIEAPASSHICQ